MALAVVTGASGFIGLHLVHHLRQLKWRVIAVVRSSSETKALAALGAELAWADMLDLHSVERAIPEHVDVIFHAMGSSLYSGHKPEHMIRNAQEGLRTIIRATHARKASCLVVLSDAIAYRTPHKIPITEATPRAERRVLKSTYARAQHACENVLDHTEGLDIVSVMPAAVLGYGLRDPRLALFRHAATTDEVIVPPGGRSFIDVKTLVSLLVAAAEHGTAGQRYPVGGEYLSWHSLLTRFVAVNHLSSDVHRQSIVSRMSDFCARATHYGNRDERENSWLIRQVVAVSADAARRDLGYVDPGIDHALEEICHWIRRS